MNTLNKLLINYMIILLSLNYSVTTSAGIYKWKDKSGQENFSDIPPNEDQNKVELLELKRKGNNSKIIYKTSRSGDDKLEKNIKKYKKIREHHSDEDVSPTIQNLKNTSGALENKINNIINQNCKIAQHNLEQLEKSSIILNENHKIQKLSKKQQATKTRIAQQHIEKYC